MGRTSIQGGCPGEKGQEGVDSLVDAGCHIATTSSFSDFLFLDLMSTDVGTLSSREGFGAWIHSANNLKDEKKKKKSWA